MAPVSKNDVGNTQTVKICKCTVLHIAQLKKHIKHPQTLTADSSVSAAVNTLIHYLDAVKTSLPTRFTSRTFTALNLIVWL